MLNPRELHNILHNDMGSQTFLSKRGPQNPTGKCHYTLQFYACTHKSYLKHPRITHIPPCPLSPSYFPDPNYFKNLGGHQETGKKRCDNMAQKPLEVYMDEVCSKCRPFSLGTGNLKQLRAFEPMIPEMKVGAEKAVIQENGEVEKMEEGKISEPEMGIAEIEKAFSDLSLSSQDQTSHAVEPRCPVMTDEVTKPKVPALVDEKQKPATSSEPEPLGSAPLKIEIPAPEPILEQPTDSTVDTDKSDIQGKSQRWVDVGPTSPNKEPAPTDAVNQPGRGIFSRMFKHFGGAKKAHETNGDERKEDMGKAAAATEEEVVEEGIDDADWDAVSDEDRKEKLWKDDGEWVNIEVV